MTTSSFDVPPPDAAAPDSGSNQRSLRKNGWIVALFILLWFLIAGVWIFLHLGTWLVVQDSLVPADVMVVLSGHMPYRAAEAALAEMRIPFVGEDFYSQRVLMANGVPALAIRILPDSIVNTADEVQEVGRIAREQNLKIVLIVTSAPHTRRVHAIWARLIGDSPRLIVRHPIDDSFNGPRWWRDSQDALDVVREWLGLANAWAGFPAKPSPN
jgi:uncharacterized SAM-binding protein YcdF (DUF218 family)